MNFSQFLTLIEGVVADGDHKMVIDNDRNEDGENDEEYEDIVLKNIKEVFDPENLGFESYKPSTVKDSKDHELWIGGEMISIPLSIYNELKGDLE